MVFFSIRGVATPPIVSIPNVKGVTSNSNTSFTSPDRTAPCMAAPIATASSGLTSLRGSFPKKSVTFSCTMGMRVWPPTKMTSLISDTDLPASLRAILSGDMVRSTNSSTKDSSLDLVSLTTRCFGPVASAVI